MKGLFQFGLLCGICWAAQCVERALPFPFPASVISLLLVLLLLSLRWVRPAHLQEVSDLLTGNLGLFFLPAGVGLINYAGVLWEHAAALLTICTVSMLLTFWATAAAVRATERLLEAKRGERHE